MELLIQPDSEAVARQAAAFIVEQSSQAIAARGVFTLALSGGTTPWRMLEWLAQSDFKWEQAVIFQIDERVATEGDEQRNWTHIRRILAARWQHIGDRAHPMPVNESNLVRAAAQYAQTLAEHTAPPAVLDLVHLGLGADGHTASLVPGDPVLGVIDRDVAVTQPYQGHVRMTLTLPTLNRARARVWLVTGAQKRDVLTRLMLSDSKIPAGHVSTASATVMADSAAVTR